MATKTADKLDALTLFEQCQEVPNLTVVDVRSPLEFQSEHIEGAINLPVDSIEEKGKELPLDNELVFVCRTGTRARRALEMAREAGLTATLLDGGMLAWKKQGLPVVEGKRRLPVDRQVQLTVGVGILTSVGLGLTVNRWFLALAGIFGAGLTYAGLSGTCGLAKALEKAPWNKLESPSEKGSSCSGSGSCGSK
mgnify:CR=1 FL=1